MNPDTESRGLEGEYEPANFGTVTADAFRVLFIADFAFVAGYNADPERWWPYSLISDPARTAMTWIGDLPYLLGLAVVISFLVTICMKTPLIKSGLALIALFLTTIGAKYLLIGSSASNDAAIEKVAHREPMPFNWKLPQLAMISLLAGYVKKEFPGNAFVEHHLGVLVILFVPIGVLSVLLLMLPKWAWIVLARRRPIQAALILLLAVVLLPTLGFVAFLHKGAPIPVVLTTDRNGRMHGVACNAADLASVVWTNYSTKPILVMKAKFVDLPMDQDEGYVTGVPPPKVRRLIEPVLIEPPLFRNTVIHSSYENLRRRIGLYLFLSGTQLGSSQDTGVGTDFRAFFGKSTRYKNAAQASLLSVASEVCGPAARFNCRARKMILVIVGHSLGGMIANQLAQDRDVRARFDVRSVVGFGTPSRPFSGSSGVKESVGFANRGDFVAPPWTARVPVGGSPEHENMLQRALTFTLSFPYSLFGGPGSHLSYPSLKDLAAYDVLGREQTPNHLIDCVDLTAPDKWRFDAR